MTRKSKRQKFYYDLAERVAWTYVQSFAAVLIVAETIDLSSFKVGAIAGLIAVAKCLIGTRIGANNSGAWLPANADPPGGAEGSGTMSELHMSSEQIDELVGTVDEMEPIDLEEVDPSLALQPPKSQEKWDASAHEDEYKEDPFTRVEMNETVES